MEIGVYWSPAVLAHKLERRDSADRVEEVWNCRACPSGMGQSPVPDLLVVASGGRWRGSFRLVPEVLFNPRDPACPYALIFDAKSWTPFTTQAPCKPFRGWTYKVPIEELIGPTSPSDQEDDRRGSPPAVTPPRRRRRGRPATADPP